MAEHNDLGKEAEAEATEFLKKKDYKILARNWRYLKAEIDIIAQDTVKNELVIVEVKARKFNSLTSPEEAVNLSKRKLLISAANEFITNQNINMEARFDIISIFKKGNDWEIKHIPNAFYIYE